MRQNREALEWGVQYLSSNIVIKYENIVQTSYSIVHRIETKSGVFYLKQTPPKLFLEARILDFLALNACKNTPSLLAENEHLHCFIMKSCGEESLRHLFKDKINFSQLKQGISNYTKIQRQMESKVEQLQALGIPDWRLNRFASLYSNLIE